MKKHLPYLEALHTKSILLTSAANPDDGQAVNGNESAFKELVSAVHENGEIFTLMISYCVLISCAMDVMLWKRALAYCRMMCFLLKT